MNKRALVLGAGGFIGSHMVTQLKKEGYWVRAVDLKYPEFSETQADEFIIGDLRDPQVVKKVMLVKGGFHELYQYAADMGGAEFIFTGEHDADLMPNSHLINIYVAEFSVSYNIGKVFYSSSACMYPSNIQEEVDSPALAEYMAFNNPPDSNYGYEKILSELLYKAYERNYNLNVCIGRFHNIFGQEGTWEGIRAKAPAAICRKVALARDGDTIEILGDGLQTRSFLYINEATEAVRRLMKTNYSEAINIGSDENISINDLAKMIIKISGKDLKIKNVESDAVGVRGRNSDNTLIEKVLEWRPTQSLESGMRITYKWIDNQLNKKCKTI